MTTRTKIGVCIGLVAVAVGAGVVAKLPRHGEDGVTLSFVRYDGKEAVLSCTNRANSVVKLGTFDALLLPESYKTVRLTNQDMIILLPGTGTRLVAIPLISKAGQQGVLPNTLQMQCFKQATWLQWKLFEFGVAPFTGTGFVVSVTLPPRETNAPTQPVTP